MLPIETDRLTIRNFSIDDSVALHAMICQYQASRYALFDHQWPTSLDEIRSIARRFASADTYLAVCLRRTGGFIGFVCLNHQSGVDIRRFNLGYTFDARFHRRGYATEACSAAIRHAFENLQAEQIVTGTAKENLPSCRLLEKLCFRVVKNSTGAFRNDETGRPIQFVGVEYVLSKGDWNTRQGVTDPTRGSRDLS